MFVRKHQTLPVLMMILLLASLILTACGGETNPTTGVPNSPTATSVAATPVPLATATTEILATATGLPATPVPLPTETSLPATPVPLPTNTNVPATAVPNSPTVVAIPSTVAAKPTTTVAAVTTSAPASIVRYVPNFAKAVNVTVNNKLAFPKYTVAANLSNVTNLKDFKLSEAQTKLLAQNYFVVEPANFKQFFQAYESFRYDQIPTYITTDSVAHVYHLLFDKLLRETEKNFLIKDLQSLSRALYNASLKQYTNLSSTTLTPAPAILRNVAFTAVAGMLADPTYKPANLPAAATKMVEAEMKLINAAAGFELSNIMGTEYREDYSQYIPRGHYTKSEELKNFFRAMIWYGRLTFRAKDESETLSALFLSQAILTGEDNGRKASELWSQIYEPTAFFVGVADDLTYLDYSNLAKTVWGNNWSQQPELLTDKSRLDAFRKGVETLPPPQINSMFTTIDEERNTQIKGLRVMGQRFTLDGYVHQNLVWRQVGTLDKQRDLPKGLDIFAAFGSEQAQKLLGEQGENNYANYATQLAKVKNTVAALPPETWNQNLYWSWLNLLKATVGKRGEGYPAYMQNEQWQNKQLVTNLASWTELRHDTLLYVKQVYAERGGGPADLPYGFVEPEPLFYARMAALANMTRTGLQQRKLIDDNNAQILTRLENAATQLKTIAQKELAGTSITEDERDYIAYWGANIEQFTLDAADADGDGRKFIDDQDSAVVADVATGVNQVLEEGTGRVNLIYVAVLINGKLTLTKGAVYSHYEFTVPLSGRLTDEAWQAQLKSGKLPEQEAWKKGYIATGVKP